MASFDTIVQIIYDVIDETNENLPENGRLTKSPDTILFDRSGLLDSLGVVHFIVAVEDRVRDELGVSITLADERAMSAKSSPFRTVTSLASYLTELIPKDV